MPTTSIGFQVGLALATAIPVRDALEKASKYTLEQISALMRSLRNTGSDLLVEEDLAAVLGRVWIDAVVSQRFKGEVLANTKIAGIPSCDTLELRSGAGPTVDRAFRDRERGDLATVIQLSLLCWTHDRKLLAAALSQCLNKRYEAQIPGSSPSPGFDGLLGTLDAISSQKSAFA